MHVFYNWDGNIQVMFLGEPFDARTSPTPILPRPPMNTSTGLCQQRRNQN